MHISHLGVLPESSRFGINPCFKVEAKARICSLAARKFPVVKNNPLKEIKTSRPHVRAQPAVKWGKPAARDGTGFPGSNEADCTRPYIWIAHRPRACVNSCPPDTNSENCSTAARRADLYPSETITAKYLGLRKDGVVAFTRSNRSWNHFAGCARLGKVETCL